MLFNLRTISTVLNGCESSLDIKKRAEFLDKLSFIYDIPHDPDDDACLGHFGPLPQEFHTTWKCIMCYSTVLHTELLRADNILEG